MQSNYSISELPQDFPAERRVFGYQTPLRMTGDILVVPACGEGRGGGHLIRSAALAGSLRRSGAAAFLHVPGKVPFPRDENLFIGEEEIRSRSWGLVVLDRFRTEKTELAGWLSLGPVAGIDEGGCRDDFDFLIDLLPSLQKKSPPNLLCPAFLPLPENSRSSFYRDPGYRDSGPPQPFRILVGFGAEDSAGLTVPAALALAKAAGPACRVTALFGPLNKSPASARALLSGAGVFIADENGNDARESFSGYDLIITHFGLGAFEALAAKVPVLLVSPGTYHEKLAKNAGFVSAGTGKQAALKLGSFLFTKGRPDEKKLRVVAGASEAAAARWLKTKPRNLGGFLLSWTPAIYRRCPACGCEKRRLLARFPDRTYRRCPACGIVFMDRTANPPQEYNTGYFFDAYKKQYGKTYLEDFPALKKNGKRRLGIIKALFAENLRKTVPAAGERADSPLTLLDIGCAYGPFLEAAGEEGFVPAGMDPSEDAVRYVREQLKFQAFRGFFPDDIPLPDNIPLPDDIIRSAYKKGPFIRNAYNAVTFWFVIEHLKDSGASLAAANRLLTPGGVLAFSTPSFSGVSRRRSLRAFLENSPADHWTIWDPGKCAGILSRYGFTVRKRVITGHHPERFPLAGRFLKPGGAAYRLFRMISRVFGLGDTFEVYAVKTRELSTGNRDG